MKKRLLPVLLAASVAVSSAPAWASEAAPPANTNITASVNAIADAAVNTVVTVSGTGGHGSVNGGVSARFNLPQAVTGDGTNLLIADTANNLIRVYRQNGTVETAAGRLLTPDANSFPRGGYNDGAIADALFNRPSSMVQGPNGRVFVADAGNHAVRAVDPDRVTTYSGGAAGYQDGGLNNARYNSPSGIAMDAAGNLYVADTLNHVIRKIDIQGTVSTVAGVPGTSGFMDGVTGKAMFNAPMGIAVSDDGGTIYVADTGNHRIRVIRSGYVSTYAGTAELIDQDGEPWGEFLDGANNTAKFNLPIGLALYNGDLLVADSGNNRIRKVTQTEVTTIAGTGEPGAADGAAGEATFHLPKGLYVQGDMLFIADTGNNMIRMLKLAE